jgi:hypothetical protein
VSIPLSSDALSSKTADLKLVVRRVRARARTEDVFPTPGGPVRIMLGMLPSFPIIFSCSIVYGFPVISDRS